MTQQQKPTVKSEGGKILGDPVKTVWIENSEETNDHSRKESIELDQDFKKAHQQYITTKLQRKKEERRLIIKQFGESSSEEDDNPPQILPDKVVSLTTEAEKKHSSHHQYLKPSTPQAHKGKHSSKAMSNKGKEEESVDTLEIVMSGKNNWIETKISITQKIVMLATIECPYYDLNKIKLLFTDIGNRCFKIKINWKNQEQIFGSSYQKNYKDHPEAFFIFSKIIHRKLSLMGRKPFITQNKIHGFPELLIKNSFIYGKILKKSRVISRWNEVFAVINQEGLFYYKKPNDKGDLLVARKSISQLWTRFEFQNEWLVVKLFESGHKIELGIPFQDELTSKRWLYHLYGLFFK